MILNDNAGITGKGFVHLKGLTKLSALQLGNTAVTDAALAHLKGLPLYWLNLQNTRITDAGLVHLGKLTYLRYLQLSGTRITGAGLMNLKGLTNLNQLEIPPIRDSRVAIDAMRRSHPHLVVSSPVPHVHEN